MRVDLRLERLDFGACEKLGLAVKLVGRELRREELAKALGDGQLRAIDVCAAAVVELYGAHGLVLHQEGHDDAKGATRAVLDQVEVARGLVTVVHRYKRLHALALEDLERGNGVLAASRRAYAVLALVGKDLLGVGYGNAHRCRLGKQQAADARGVIGREAMVAAAKGLGGNGKGPLGCLGAHGVWHQVDGAKGNDDHGKPRTREHGGRDVTLRDAPRHKKQQECRHGTKGDVYDAWRERGRVVITHGSFLSRASPCLGAHAGDIDCSRWTRQCSAR